MTWEEDEARVAGFFGRRRGKRLRDEQAERMVRLLPSLRLDLTQPLDNPTRLFPVAVRCVRLEIGFGGGEHLIDCAVREPDVGFIGCEPFVNGVAKLMGEIDQRGLKNIRVYDENAADLLDKLPAGALDRIYLLYPDPWPKRRQRKRRFVSDETLAAFARLLRSGGEFRFASDIDDYIGWTLSRALRQPQFHWQARSSSDWKQPYEHWPGTRYEAKAIREGRVPSYLTFIKD